MSGLPGPRRVVVLVLGLCLAVAVAGRLPGPGTGTPSGRSGAVSPRATAPALPPSLRFRCIDPSPGTVGDVRSGVSPPGPLLPAPSASPPRTLAPGQVHRYRLPLRRGQVVWLAVEQRDLDVEVRLCDPRGRGVVRVDAPRGDRSVEEVFHTAERSGAYRLEVRRAEGGAPEPGRAWRSGTYRVVVSALRLQGRDGGARRDRLAAAVLAYQRGEMARRVGAGPVAETFHRFALVRFLSLGDESREALSRRRLAAVCRSRGDFDCAVREARHALALGQRQDDPDASQAAAADLGYGRRLAGDLEGAEAAYRRALELAREGGNRRQRATALLGLGRLAAERGRPAAALDLLRASARLWWLDGAAEELAVARLGLGDLYLSLGARERAGRLYRSAATTAAGAGDPPPRLAVRLAEAWAWYGATGEAGPAPEEAVPSPRTPERAARLASFHGLRRTAFVARDGEARVASWHGPGRGEETGGGKGGGEDSVAWEAWREARRLARGQGEAAALAATRGRLHLRAGRPREALPDLLRAARRARSTGEAGLEAALLDGVLRAGTAAREEEASQPSAAAVLEQARRFAGLLEGLRRQLSNPELRWLLVADRRPTLSLRISRLVAGPAGAARALEAAERGRARSLLDELAAARPAPAGRGVETRSLVRLDRQIRDLHRELASFSLHREERVGIGPAGAALESLERRLDDLLWRWRTTLTAVAGAPPAVLPYDARTLQRHLLGERQALLVYWLGAEESYLWWVQPHRLEVHRLPPRHALETVAVRLHGALAGGPRVLGPGQVEADAGMLGDLLLGPVAGHLEPGMGLVVVPDGALQGIPFALLPVPGRPSRRLVEEHPLTVLPSASVGLVLRRRALLEPSSRRGVLALVDGVYTARDERLQGEGRLRALALEKDRLPLPRLPSTAREGEAIRRFAGAGGSGEDGGPVRVLAGFDARVEALSGGGASGLRILHLATHARPDPRRPRLSGLVLSRFDAAGRPVEGFLPAYALAAGDLRCDLAVLSACSTAAGEAVPGEGILGLARAFLVAGADRVLVSLWDVDDEATAELMELFYRGLLGQGLDAASALSRAQAALSRDPRWRDPFFWAGFVLVGDRG